MTAPTEKPTYVIVDYKYQKISDSYFGKLLFDNSRNVEKLEDFINVLTEESAEKIWKQTFGNARHKADIKKENWSTSLYWSAVFGDWLKHYNNCDSQPIERQLKKLVDWHDNQTVIFFKGPYDSIITSWRLFVQNCLTFFEYDDDGPFIIPVDGSEVLRISPNGSYMIGVPPKNSADEE